MTRKSPALTSLQSVVWPSADLDTPDRLHLRRRGPCPARHHAQPGAFATDTGLRFDTYFNLFNLGKWQKNCSLGDLGLSLTGSGQARVRVFLCRPKQTDQLISTQDITLSETATTRLDLTAHLSATDQAILYFDVLGQSDGWISDAHWDSYTPPHTSPTLALVITTFKREEAVANTVTRFEAFRDTSPLGQNMHLFVVDNGGTAPVESSAAVTVTRNRNHGGAGGFARGLMQAQEAAYSHCLFMDDDAATSMQAIARTYTFLSYATDPQTAVAGAMISSHETWALWENGATFNGACRSQYGGADLRQRKELYKMEFGSAACTPANFYGGWWFFAFPIAHTRHLPFPFFVRGDDVSFALAHDFNIQTLPGVVSLQESFVEKDSPLTWYLDLRSHLAHHLSLRHMSIGRLRTVKIALWFWLRALVPAHYETISALNLAVEDVLAGPDHFAAQGDLSERRSQLNALRQTEAWTHRAELPTERRRVDPNRFLPRLLMKVSLNGHFLPFFTWLGNHVTITAHRRWNPRALWGAAQVTYFNPATGHSYTVRHDKRRALRESARLLRLCLQLLRRYGPLQTQWQQAYPRLTAASYWRKALGLSEN